MTALDNPKWEAFAQDVAKGTGPTAAYRKHVARGKCSDGTATTEGSKLAKNPDVALRISGLKGVISKKLGEKFDWDADKALTWLVSILETPVGSINENHPLCQEVRRGMNGTTIKMPGKIDAARLMAQMAGWLAPEKREVAISLTPEAEQALDQIFGK